MEEPKRRGRPRAYDPDEALDRALATFWVSGYSGTSLDALGAAMGMNRPSLYRAFGDKEALYLKALERYRSASRTALAAALDPERPLRASLHMLVARALALYLSGGRGCFVVGTAAAEAVTNPVVRAAVAASCRELDEVFTARFRVARERGEVADAADPAALGQLASAVLHTLAIRARAGEPRRVLEPAAAAMVDALCGAAQVAS